MNQPKTRLVLAADAIDHVAYVGLTMKEWAERAEISYATIKGIKNPRHQKSRRGGMHRVTAWKLVKAYAQVAQIDDQTAFSRIIREERAA